MGKKTEKQKYYIDSGKLDHNKNFMVLKILSYVPEFKKDVSEIREKMGIKDGGFEWDNEEMLDWAEQKNIKYYQGVEIGDEEEGQIPYIGIPSISDDEVRKDFPSNDFENKMFELGTKYKLPFNLYAFPSDGLPRYVLSGEIKSSHKNYYTSFHEAGDKSIWSSLFAYTPLSLKELKEAVNDLKYSNMGTLSSVFEGIDVLSKKRYRNEIYRDLSLFEEQVSRSSKPKKVKHYESTYLDILSRDKTTSAKTLKKAERDNKKYVVSSYDKPTSKQIGKKQGVSGDATRQSKRRLNLLAKELFGYDLEL